MSTTKNATAPDTTVTNPENKGGAPAEKKLSKLERRALRNDEKRKAKDAGTPPVVNNAKGVTPETTPKTTTPSKKKTKAKTQLDDANIAIAGAKAEGKELLYKYPADVKTQQQKKDFRRKMRAENKKFSRELAQLKRSTEKNAPKDLVALEKKYNQFRKETYSKA